ncbi:S-layer homology domain-containing protein [Acidaminobacter sp. JC074]|uniref:S-layer homology domain-containing protein n=1 Tax=Acidaminobacter sp. JC074 TaxID=2530199 RepID=UPI001F0CE232|nr:S-layer homology domain-containing protein [Acidaminobacter sp. JC074]
MNNFKRILSMTLIVVILFGMLTSVFASPSDWAEPFVKAMLLEGLASEELLDTTKMQHPITREEFAELTVRLYAKSKGQKIEDLVEWNPFADSNNKMVAKAFNLGIVSGTGFNDEDQRLFSPSNLVTRQEIAVMLVKELKLLGVNTTSKGEMAYSDEQAVAAWAYDAVNFASENGILSGVGNNQVAPTANATREQALVLIHKIASKYGWVENKYVDDHFSNANSSEIYGLRVPNNDASELIVFKTDTGLKYVISNMVSSYRPDILSQQEDLINIFYQSDVVKYDTLKTMVELIQSGYDPTAKKFNSSNTVYINLSNGFKSSTVPSGSYFKYTVDGNITIEYVK